MKNVHFSLEPFSYLKLFSCPLALNPQSSQREGYKQQRSWWGGQDRLLWGCQHYSGTSSGRGVLSALNCQLDWSLSLDSVKRGWGCGWDWGEREYHIPLGNLPRINSETTKRGKTTILKNGFSETVALNPKVFFFLPAPSPWKFAQLVQIVCRNKPTTH